MEINDTISIIPDKNYPKPLENYDILDLDNAINTYHNMSSVKFTLMTIILVEKMFLKYKELKNISLNQLKM